MAGYPPGRVEDLAASAAPILLVDDRPENLVALRAILEPLGQRLVQASSGEEALKALLAEVPAVILLDVQMPGLDGYETATLIKGRERTKHVPIIFLTAIDEERREELRGYSAGAVDFLFKPFDPTVLRSKVQVFIELHELRLEAERLAHRALHDPLTGLPNRALFHDRLTQALARSRRLSSQVGVLFLDLDDFKPVNDLLGHESGDALLVELAARLSQALRPADTVARLGGDEFAILSDGLDGIAEATDIADRLLETIAQPYALPGGKAGVAGSIGIALDAGGGSPERLVREADAAMYEAKAAGGGRHAVYDGAMRAEAARRERSRDMARRLLEDGRFTVVHAERVAADGGGHPAPGVGGPRPHELAVRIRWHAAAGPPAPTEGYVGLLDAPGADAGMAGALLRRMLQAASELHAAHPEAQLAVPVPAGVLAADGGDEAVLAAVAGCAVPAELLRLELPEGVLQGTAPPGIGKRIARLAERCALALRDFGEAGVPPAVLADMDLRAVVLADGLLRPGEGPARAAVGAVALAHAFGLQVVGVAGADPLRAERARRAGCETIEGAAGGWS